MCDPVGPPPQLPAPERDDSGSPLSTAAVLAHIRTLNRELEAEPGLTALQLAERTGLARRHVVLLLLRLEERGHLVHEGRRWFPVADGLL